MIKSEHKNCTYCNKVIKAKAIKCKHKYNPKSLYHKGFYHVLIVPWMAKKVQTFIRYYAEIFNFQRTACLC